MRGPGKGAEGVEIRFLNSVLKTYFCLVWFFVVLHFIFMCIYYYLFFMCDLRCGRWLLLRIIASGRWKCGL